VNKAIEIHDSTVAAIASWDDAVTVNLLPAYVHASEGRPGFDSGTCWIQDAKLVLVSACVSGNFPNLPCEVMDGALTVGNKQFDNEIPIPLDTSAITELRLVFDSDHVVTVVGKGARIELIGEPRFVEEFER
jgi:hypothetical protein